MRLPGYEIVVEIDPPRLVELERTSTEIRYALEFEPRWRARFVAPTPEPAEPAGDGRDPLEARELDATRMATTSARTFERFEPPANGERPQLAEDRYDDVVDLPPRPIVGHRHSIDGDTEPLVDGPPAWLGVGRESTPGPMGPPTMWFSVATWRPGLQAALSDEDLEHYAAALVGPQRDADRDTGNNADSEPCPPPAPTPPDTAPAASDTPGRGTPDAPPSSPAADRLLREQQIVPRSAASAAARRELVLRAYRQTSLAEWTSTGTIAEMTGLERGYVGDASRKLAETGLLEHNGRQKAASRYRARSLAEDAPPAISGRERRAQAAEARKAGEPGEQLQPDGHGTLPGRILSHTIAQPSTIAELAAALGADPAEVGPAVLDLEREGDLARHGRRGNGSRAPIVWRGRP